MKINTWGQCSHGQEVQMIAGGAIAVIPTLHRLTMEGTRPRSLKYDTEKQLKQ